MRAHRRAFHAAQISPTGTAVAGRVAVDHFAPEAAMRHPQHVVGARHRRHVADHQQRGCGDALQRRKRLAQEGEDAVAGVIGFNPLEAVGREIELVQRGLAAVDLIQRAHKMLHTRMAWKPGGPPFELAVVCPFAALGKLTAHEHEFFAGVAPHEAKQSAQVGKLLPRVARHLVDQRALAVHHFVVRQRQHELLAKGIRQ